MSDPNNLSGTVWVHVFEEDTPKGAVFRPSGGNIPLSRRPRERFTLSLDGSATLFAAGPDDRLVEHAASWSEEGGELVIRDAANAERLRVVFRAADRLVVRLK